MLNSKTNNFQDATKATQTENNTFNHKDSETTNYNNRIDSVLVLLSSLSGVVLMAYVVCNLFFCIRRSKIQFCLNHFLMFKVTLWCRYM